MIQNDTKEMKKEKQQNMGTAEAGAHDVFVVLTVGEGQHRDAGERYVIKVS